MVDFQFLIEALIGVAMLAAIALIGSNFSAIVSTISELSARARAEGEARKAYRQQVYNMSNIGSDEPDRGAGTGAAIVVPGHQHQAALELVPNFEIVKAYLTDHTLTDEEAIELLALARRSSGDDLLSANKIRDIVGGNEGKVKARVAAHRRPRPRPKAAQRLERPVNGWNKA